MVRTMPAGALPLALVAGAGCQELPRTYDTTPDAGLVVFEESFDEEELRPMWRCTAPGFSIERGVLTHENSKNHPLWLAEPLPRDYRIELDVWADSEEGDVKIELNGDGRSFAKSVNYRPSGYVLVFGGWNNQFHVIAKRNEHGKDRVETTTPEVEPGRHYHFVITRVGAELVWEVDGRELLRYEDPRPLHGPGHDRFGFGGWEARTHFDNLVIESLELPETEGATATPWGGRG